MTSEIQYPALGDTVMIGSTKVYLTLSLATAMAWRFARPTRSLPNNR